jgi:murein hydrolase activator
MSKRLLLIFFLWPVIVFAQESGSSSAKLQTLTQEIDALTQTLAEDKNEREKLQQILKALDLQIAESSKKLKQTQTALAKSQKALAEIEVTYQQELQHLALQQDAMKEQIRGTFLLGQNEALKLLLSQNDPHTLGRLLVYYDYFNVARSDAMEGLQENLTALEKTQALKQTEQAQLNRLKTEQAEEHALLAGQQKTQSALVGKLLASIEQKNLTLETMLADKQALESVIVDLAQQTDTFMGSSDKPIRDYRGKLPWPVAGKVLHRFGDPYLAENTWQGMVIAAPEGSVVRAIYKGRVEYADWLRGLGLIIIVNHGDGYMSLYAHNQSLYKNVGDVVDVNDPIALVGKSGSVVNSGLYFEIRSQGEVQNPMLWLMPAASSS